MSIVVEEVLKSYGDVSWGELPNFQGDYINYGYWKDIKIAEDQEITVQQRIESSLALYRLIADKLNVRPKDNILEVGCGRAPGLICLARLYPETQFKGIDITPQQLRRANLLLAQSGLKNVNLYQASAESPGFTEHTFDKVYSIEAMQHFVSVSAFIEAAASILKPKGKLCVTTYLARGVKERKEVEALFPLIEQNIEEPLPIGELFSILVKYGFSKIHVTTIGEDVFYGYERWNTQAKVPNAFSHNYYKAYQLGLVEYYVIEAELN